MTITDSRRSQQNESNKQKRQENRDSRHEIGEIPKCKDQGLRSAVLDDPVLFLETFFSFPPFFTDPFGPVQIDSIHHEDAVLSGNAGNINKLEPRAYGKSTRSLILAIRAILKGDQEFMPICCNSKTRSDQLLRIGHAAVGRNKELLAIFPELYPFHLLKGNPHACLYQTFNGVKTEISIKGDAIQFPKMDGKYPSERAILTAIPFESARGLNIEGYRPGAIVLDDVQKTKDAMSPTAPGKLIQIVKSDIAYLGTRQNPVSIINNATIIAPGDFPSLLADMDAFTTIRYKMVESFPDGCDPKKGVWTAHWTRYFELRAEFEKGIVGDRERAGKRSAFYYWLHRKEMDSGSSVTWDYAFSWEKKQEISSIQAAINFLNDFGWESFCSECQNEPVEKEDDKHHLSAKQITEKQHGYERGKIPPGVTIIEAGVDVQMEMIFFEVWGFDPNFSGFKILDGEFPSQRTHWFEKRHLKHKLSNHPDYKHLSTVEARIKAATLDVWAQLAKLEFNREGDGSRMTISHIGTDIGFNGPTIEEAYLESPHKSRILLTRGYGFTSKQRPQRFKEVKRGGGKGFGWFQSPANNRGVQPVEVDTNILKSFFHDRLATAIGDPGSFSLWKDDPKNHELSASHYKAERRDTIDAGRGWGPVDEWQGMPGRPDNDRLDTAVIAIACASKDGVKMVGTKYTEGGNVKRKKVNLASWGS